MTYTNGDRVYIAQYGLCGTVIGVTYYHGSATGRYLVAIDRLHDDRDKFTLPLEEYQLTTVLDALAQVVE